MTRSLKLHMKKAEELRVLISTRESTCNECGENLGSKAWITLTRDQGALCLACDDSDHLIFFDQFLSKGYDRREARTEVEEAVYRVLENGQVNNELQFRKA